MRRLSAICEMLYALRRPVSYRGVVWVWELPGKICFFQSILTAVTFRRDKLYTLRLPTAQSVCMPAPFLSQVANLIEMVPGRLAPKGRAAI